MMKYKMKIISGIYSKKNEHEQEYLCIEDVVSDINAFFELKGDLMFLPNAPEEYERYSKGKGETVRIDIYRIE